RVTLLGGGPILALGLYLFAAGAVLNLGFGRRLAALRAGGEAPRTFRGGVLARVYGGRLLTLDALGYLLLPFCAVLVIEFGLLSFDLLLRAGSFPRAVPIALLAVIGASLVGIVRGVFVGVRGGTFGLPVTPQEEPALWALSRSVAAGIGTRPPDRIVLSPLPGIGVHEEGGLLRLLVGRTRRVLTIGAPSITGLTTQEFRAVL